MSWVYFLKDKSETFDNFKKFKAMVKKRSEESIKTLGTDRGGEFLSHDIFFMRRMVFGGNLQLHIPSNKMVLRSEKIERWLKWPGVC